MGRWKCRTQDAGTDQTLPTAGHSPTAWLIQACLYSRLTGLAIACANIDRPKRVLIPRC